MGPLAPGDSLDTDSTVQISAADANAVLGNAPGTPVSADDLLNADVFLLVRVDSGEALLEHNETNIAVIQLARLVDVVLVLDRSGSMDGDVPVSSGVRRKIDVLKSSANLFLDVMRLDTDDRLAQVSFSGNMGADSITTDFGPAGTLVEIGAANIDDARDAVNDLEPGRATDIRGALQQALDVITAPGDVGLDKFFVQAVGGAIRSDIILDPIDDIAAGQVHFVDVPVADQAATATFILTWDNPNHPLDLSVRSPSGALINAANFSNFGGRVSRIKSGTYELIRIRFPLAINGSEDQDGRWRMHISNPNAITVRYSACAINGEPLSDRERLLLAAEARFGRVVVPRADSAVTSLPSGDAPSLFKGTFNETAHEGVYRFTTTVDGLSDCQPFRRELTTSATVSTGADPEITVVEVTPGTNGAGTVVVTVVPVTTTGGHVGPGYASDIQISAGHLAPTSKVVDRFDGGYTQHFKLKGSGTAPLKINVMGTAIETQKLDTRVPAPDWVTPTAGDNADARRVTVSFDTKANLKRIDTIWLTAPGYSSVRLSDLRVDQNKKTIQASIPKGVPPGLYAVRTHSTEGQGVSSGKVQYRIKDKSGALPTVVDQLSKTLVTLSTPTSRAHTMQQLGMLLRHIAALPTGKNLTRKQKRSATDQVLTLIAQPGGRITPSDIDKVKAVLTRGIKDAR